MVMLLVLGLLGIDGDAAPDFATRVMPVLEEHCVGCHLADDPSGGLVLETHAAILKGGANGPALVPGKADQSRLYRMTAHTLEPFMPPESDPIPTAQLALLRAWIDAGAKDSAVAAAPRTLSIPEVPTTATPREPVRSVAWSPDGGLVAVGQYEQVLLVDPATGYVVRKLVGPTGPVNDVRFSADGKTLVAAAGEAGLFGEATLFDVATGSARLTVRGHADSLYAATLSPDGTRLATAGYDRDVRLWDAADGRAVAVMGGHQEVVYDLAYRPDGKVLASVGADRTVKLWDAVAGVRLDTLTESADALHAVAFSPDGRRVAAAGVDNRIRVWSVSADAAEGANHIVHAVFAHRAPLVRLAYSHDGKMLVSGAQDRTVKLWHADSVAEIGQLPPQPDWPAALALAPADDAVLIGRHDGTLALHDLPSGTLRSELAPTVPPAPVLTEIRPAVLDTDTAAELTLVGEHLDTVAAVRLSGGNVAAELADGGRSLKLTPAKDVKPGDLTVTLVGPGGESQPLSVKVADLKPPELTAALPGALVAGTTTEVRLFGRHLEHLRDVTGGGDRVRIERLADRDGVVVRVTADADLPASGIDLKVATAGGTSKPLRLTTDDVPQTAEPAGDRTIAAGTAWGLLEQPGEADTFRYEPQGERPTTVAVAAHTLDGPLLPVVTVRAESGEILAASGQDGATADPLLVVPAGSGPLTIEVRDLQYGGSVEHRYALTVGPYGYATSVFPEIVATGGDGAVEIRGVNLLQEPLSVTVPTDQPGDRTPPLPAGVRSRGGLTVAVAADAPALETEPNDAVADATALTAPFTVEGRFLDGTPDHYRFAAAAGETWVIETDAARRGLPVDTRIAVLDAAGEPVLRTVLQAIRDSRVAFRHIDSRQENVRVDNWQEMELNQFLWMDGEVAKLYRLPEGPDSGFLFYGDTRGRRRTYFDTSATTHALDDPAYIVQPLPPGAEPLANGLPTFPLPYGNDDAEDRELGADSRVTFTAPAAGDYVVRVEQVNGRSGPECRYRLAVRRPQPGYRVFLAGGDLVVPAGAAIEVEVRTERIDGFDGPIAVALDDLPAGFAVSGPTTIEAGHLNAHFAVTVAADAPPPTAEQVKAAKVVASAEVAGTTVEQAANGPGALRKGEPPKYTVSVTPKELTIRPGETIVATLAIDRAGFDGEMKFDARNLPHGVYVDDIGLSGILVRKGESAREVRITARDWVEPTDREFFFRAQGEGNLCSPATLLHVRRPTAVADRTPDPAR